MKIAVLAVQGAFAERAKRVQELGAEAVELRQKADVLQSYDGMILPGGESTVQGKLLRDLELFEPLRERIFSGLPVFGTCAGLLLLAKRIENDERSYFAAMDILAVRNAYGRQLGSFYTEADCRGIGKIPMTFIRAPGIVSSAPGVRVMARVDGAAVAVEYGRQMAMAFHPELDPDRRLHRRFVNMI